MRRVVEFVLMIAILSAAAAGQAPAPTATAPSSGGTSEMNNQVYGGFLWEPTDWGAAWANFKGFDLNYTRDFGKRFGAVADFDRIRNNESQAGDLDRGNPHNATAYGYRFGPRYNILKSRRIQPYLVALFGGAHLSALLPYPGRQSPLVQKDFTGFSYAVGGGVDFRITHHIGARAQWDHTRVPWGTELTDASDWDRVTFGATWRW